MDGTMAHRLARVTVVALLVAPVLVVSAGPALACSCAGGRGLQNSVREDGVTAFVGVVRRVTQAVEGNEYTFRVDSVLAGGLPRTVQAYSLSPSGDLCGVDLAVGDRVGFLLGRAEGRWVATTCGQVEADALLAAGSWRGWLTSTSAIPWYAVTVIFVLGFGGAVFAKRRKRIVSG